MKLLSKLRFYHLIPFLFLGLLVSCADQKSSLETENVITPELIDLRVQVQNHESFIKYEKSNDLFFSQLENKEIELFSIISFLNMNKQIVDCNEIARYEREFRGYEKYAIANCSKKSFYTEIFSTFDKLDGLSKKELKYILKPTKSEKISTRRIDCLDMFQLMWAEEPSPGGMTVDQQNDGAIAVYENCCEDKDGTDGCP